MRQHTTDRRNWPKVIPLPQPERPRHDGQESPADVRSPDDLPGRFFLGRLDRDSVRIHKDGWSATYRAGIEKTFCNVDYERARQSLSVLWTYRGDESMLNVARAERFQDILLGTGPCLPDGLKSHVRDRITGSYHLHYPNHDDEVPCSVFFPDGYMFMIVCPVPVSRLPRLVGLMKAIDDDPRISAVVGGQAIHTWSVVNYVEGRNAWPWTDPNHADLHTMQILGTPMYQPSIWQTSPEGLRALTVARTHYTLEITCFLCDLEIVLQHLNAHGILAFREDASEYPGAHEYIAFVAPCTASIITKQIVVFNKARTRCLIYGGFGRTLLSEIPLDDAAPEASISEALAATARLQRYLGDETTRRTCFSEGMDS